MTEYKGKEVLPAFIDYCKERMDAGDIRIIDKYGEDWQYSASVPDVWCDHGVGVPTGKDHYKYRLKPQTIRIGDVEVEKPTPAPAILRNRNILAITRNYKDKRMCDCVSYFEFESGDELEKAVVALIKLMGVDDE